MKPYALEKPPATTNFLTPNEGMHLAFDVGHSSIGWAVLDVPRSSSPQLLGTGVVTFPADGCLASQRRGFRRQRRHIRATRQRIFRIERLLAHLGVITTDALEVKHKQGGGHSAPWFLAARVLRGGDLLTWPELWDVIRWYAHNRGYDGNKAWSAHEAEADKEDTEKVERAKNLLTDFFKKYSRTGSMAEVFCDVSGLDPLGTKMSCHLAGDKRPKALNAAFPREDVENEVRTILTKHIGTLPRLDADFIRALLEDWTAVPCESIRLPGRYGQILPSGKRTPGGLLFGQLVPRFDNRIIATCHITFEHVYGRILAETGDATKAKREAEKLAKVPAKDCPEFLRYRWAMQVANIQVGTGEGRKTRTLSVDERIRLNTKMRERGFFTPAEFKKAVREITGESANNIEQMLTHPDADKALILDPARKALAKPLWNTLFPLLPEAIQKRAVGKLRLGKTVKLGTLIADAPFALDPSIEALLSAANSKKGKSQKSTTREEILQAATSCDSLTGRAPYSRAVMRDAADFVFATNRHPTEGSPDSNDNGPLYRSEAIRNAQLQRAIADQTNNHLVRHRLLILERLHRDILKEYAATDPARIARVTIEVNRDLREFSGKTAKQVAQDFGQRLANFKNVAARLEKAFEGKNIRLTPGLIRKARIAEDLGWKCPYTGQSYDEFDLLHRRVDKDHIIPRSERASDSLDALVITFSEVNRMKGKRTAVRFIEECGGQAVEGRPQTSIKALTNFQKDVAALETFKGHDDDKRRKKNRKRLLELRDYVEKEFTPGDLTQTSQLVRLGAQMLERAYTEQTKAPTIVSLPGSVTGTIRKSWRLLGCLATANPLVINNDDLDEHGRPRIHSKTDIRGITHLHHALDACVIALSSLLFPRDGGVWELLIKRKLNQQEQATLKSRIGNAVEFAQDGSLQLTDLPTELKDQIRTRLAERRVVQHIPREMTGLSVEQNSWRVVSIKDGEALLRQRMRQPDGTRPVKETKEKIGKLLGLFPDGGIGKLQQNKAALVIPDNYGLALDPEPQIIPFHKVPVRLRELREKNGGNWPRVLRNGMLIRVPAGRYAGTWRVFSTKAALTLDLGATDKVALGSKGDGQKREVRVETLIRDGLEIVNFSLTGVSTPPKEL